MNHAVLTIGRLFGSGGRRIGKQVAELCGMTYYDTELLTIAAEKSGMNRSVLENIDESANSMGYSLPMEAEFYGAHFSQPISMTMQDKLFIIQSNIIKQIAEKESCVIVGRCADYLLRDRDDCINIFITAPVDIRAAKIMEDNGISLNKACEMIRKTEKKRASYYNFYTGKKWGDIENYHLTMDSSLLGVPKSAEIVAEIVKSAAGKFRPN